MKTGKLSREELSRLVHKLGKGKRAKSRPDRAERGKAAAGTSREARRDRTAYPVSTAQQRLWFFDRLLPGSTAYNVPVPLRLRGALDAPVLHATVREIVRRHPSLRTRFTFERGEPIQVVEPAVPVPLPVVDLRSLPRERAGEAATAVARAEARHPFDLATGGLSRFTLVRIAPREHLLSIVFHHIVADGWSIGVFLRELAALYPPFTRGEPSPLPEPTASYADFVEWERERLAGAELERNLRSWRDRLAGAPAVLRLPTDRPAPKVRSDRGASAWLAWSPELTEDFRALCADRGVTLFTGLLATFQTLLARHADTDSPVVGVPLANRPLRDLEGLIGMFVNTLPLRAELADSPTFAELFERTAVALSEAQEHAVPFERLVEHLHPDRDLTHPPVYQVTFGLQNTPRSELHLPGLELEIVPLDAGGSKLDLSLQMIERNDRLEGELQYSTELFDRTTVQRLLGHLERLASAAVARPDQRVGELSGADLLGPAERQQLLREWNDSARPRSREWRTVVERVAARAVHAPDAVALVDGSETVTYGELERRARALAARLVALGVAPEERVGILADRSVELVVAEYATLRAGGAYVPLDPSYPVARVRFMVDDAETRVVLARRAQQDVVAELAYPTETETGIDVGTVTGPKVVWLGGEAGGAAEAQEPGAPPEPGAGPGSLAYVIFTSGSTGRPKGTLLAHESLANLVGWHVDAYGLSPDDRTSMVAGPGFDASVWEIWPTLSAGATLTIVDRETAAAPERLPEWLAARRVTVGFLPTPVAEAFLDESEAFLDESEAFLDESEANPDESDAAPAEPVPTLRTLLTGGDALHRRPAPGSGFELFNHYGPTESTVVTTRSRVTPRDATGRPGPPPIGRPIANLRAHVLDAALRPAPLGVPGELCAAGAGLSRGYLGRPGLTAERFVPNPFGETVGSPGDRLYRTGDLVRLRPDGEIEFLGRLDHQVKIRGFRIELGEIEDRLQAVPEVAAAVVLASTGAPGGGRLDAYVVPAPPAQDRTRGRGEIPAERLVRELRNALAVELPDYMVPATFTVLDGLPLTPNGKVDRRALAAEAGGPGAPGRRAAAVRVAPRTSTEKAVAEIWEELLDPDGSSGLHVGVHDDFFALGGHSLLVTRLMARLRERLGIDLPVRTAFENPTLGALAAVVEAAPRGEAPPVEPASRERDLPLSFAQERLWFLDRMEPGRAWYNLPAAVRLTGDLDVLALARGLGEIVRRHEALRTVFRETGEASPVQVVRPAPGDGIPMIDLSALDPARREAEAAARTGNEASRPFDLTTGPLLRSLLLRVDPTEHVLVVTMHHIVSDGWSVGIFLRELGSLYAAFR
ncbi:MAG: amino acid adenylation domain-containing protein, partial [Acidobacteriota bacterium]